MKKLMLILAIAALMTGGTAQMTVMEPAQSVLGPESSLTGDRITLNVDEVEVRGIHPAEAVRQALENRSRRIRRIVMLDPLKLRDRLPRALVEWLFARLALLVRRPSREPTDGGPEITWCDFPVGPADAGCLDLLAMCRRPR